jgi:aspartate aminotransferase
VTHPLARRLASLRPSATLAMDARARALVAAGEPILNLSAGQPDFPTPPHILDAAQMAMRAGQTRYTDAAGTNELRAAIAAITGARVGRAYGVEHVIVSAGVKQALYHVLLALLGEGDEAVIPVPAWGTYAEQVRLSGGIPVPLPLEASDNFQVNRDALCAAVTPRTRVLVLNSPCNPTGTVLDAASLDAVATVALEKDLVVVSDEIYHRVVYGTNQPASPASLSDEMADRTVILDGVSKTYAMTGWRIGYAVGPRSIIEGAIRIQEQSSGNPCSISQAASLAALTGPDDTVRRMVEEFSHRRRVGVEAVSGWPATNIRAPDGAFYLFPRVSWNADDLVAHGWPAGGAGLAEYLLEVAHVAVVPGEAFDGAGFLRLSFAVPERDLLAGIERIGEALAAIARGAIVQGAVAEGRSRRETRHADLRL